MKPLIMLMLAVQVLAFVAVAVTVVSARPKPGSPRPVWSSLAISMIVIASASWQIGDSHVGDQGADLLMWGAPFLLGMGVLAILLLIRQRRGLDSAP